ncbi:hypothetical protein DKK74_00170 [Bifidobacterium asteroides]|uniref:Uncharacterized protein n=1 Tax=Bifidobacterium asteroides TaxID=1684 RepID=A0A318MNC5_9BIFI|nr:hypothetical protein DKK74_00170 [Bifidobacterium asteroides]
MSTFQVMACESVLFVSAALSKPLPPVDWTPWPATNIIIADTKQGGERGPQQVLHMCEHIPIGDGSSQVSLQTEGQLVSETGAADQS